MNILIDADACPVIRKAEETAKKYDISVTLYCDTNHILSSEYSKIKTVAAGSDSVDFAIVKDCKTNDIVITQDYGLAAIVLAKKCACINQNGMLYTNENIDSLLFSRHISRKLRKSSKKSHLKGNPKRTSYQNESFCRNFEKLILSCKKNAEA